MATNGVCGASNNQNFSAAPTTNLCNPGTASAISGTGPWTWTCTGINGGNTSPICTANKIINGVCGATHYLCTAGTSVANVPGATSYTWTCNGINGGSDDTTCSEAKLFSATINVLDTPSVNTCSAGTAYSGAKVTSNASITGNGTAGTSFTTNASGQVALTNITPGSSYRFTLSGIGANSINPGCANGSSTINATFASDGQTLNWYISPPAPTCTMTASPSVVDAGGTSTLTASYTLSSGVSGTPTYTWYADTTDVPGATIINQSVDANNVYGAWKAPSAYYQQHNAYPSIQICNPNGGACGSCGITIKPPASCSTGQTYPYSVCQNNTCSQVNACGTTDCSACPPTPTITPTATPPVCSTGQTYPYSVCQSGTVRRFTPAAPPIARLVLRFQQQLHLLAPPDKLILTAFARIVPVPRLMPAVPPIVPVVLRCQQ